MQYTDWTAGQQVTHDRGDGRGPLAWSVGDVYWNSHDNCPCRARCPRLHLTTPDGQATQTRACQVQLIPQLPYSADTTTPDGLQRTVRAYPAGAAGNPVYRVEASHSGGILKYDTPDGLADLARSYTDPARAYAAALTLTAMLGEGHRPEFIAQILDQKD